MPKLTVLYVYHNKFFCGASRSLLEMILAFPDNAVIPLLLSPRGNVTEIFSKHGIDILETSGVAQFDHTRYGYYRSLRWLILLREVFHIPATVWTMVKARRRWKHIDIIHINEITSVLSILLAKVLFRCPIVVHVRSVQQTERGRLRKKIMRLLLHNIDAVVTIDVTVSKSLPDGIKANVIHNGFSTNSYGALKRKNYTNDSFLNRPMRVLFVGSLMVMKGIVEYLKAAKKCADHLMNVQFVIVGETGKPSRIRKVLSSRFLRISQDMNEYCLNFVSEHELGEVVTFTGFTYDIADQYLEADLVCFPSHLNSVGRPVIEAALFKVPSIVAIDSPDEDTIIHNETGLCIQEKNVDALFDAIEYFYRNPMEISRMGESAHALATENFNIKKNAALVYNLYGELIVNQG